MLIDGFVMCMMKFVFVVFVLGVGVLIVMFVLYDVWLYVGCCVLVMSFVLFVFVLLIWIVFVLLFVYVGLYVLKLVSVSVCVLVVMGGGGGVYGGMLCDDMCIVGVGFGRLSVISWFGKCDGLL